MIGNSIKGQHDLQKCPNKFVKLPLRRQFNLAMRKTRRSILLMIQDALYNARYTRGDKRILIVRHRKHLCNYNNHFLRWVMQQVPEAAPLFELHRIPHRIKDPHRYALFLPWLQDPLKEKFPGDYYHAKQIEMQCQEYNIPVINSVDTLSNSIKSLASRTIGSVGIRTPKMVPIVDPEAFKREQGGLSTPFFIREDRGHGGRIFFVRFPDELQHIPFEAFTAPVAVEFIDSRDKDGLYRKYRYAAIGDEGVPCQLMISASWEVRAAKRIANEAAVAEELAYLNKEDPNHDILQSARRSLGFDFVAFDYSYDAQGSLVVWEPNPLPVHWPSLYNRQNMKYLAPAQDRLYTKLLRYYLMRANLSSIVLSI